MADKKKIKVNDKIEVSDKDNKKDAKFDSDNNDQTKDQDPLKEIEAKLDAAENEAKQSYDRFLRASAELENYKKRSAREMGELRKFANESLLMEMLSVVDNLERAIDSSGNEKDINHCVIEGVNLTLKEILRVFEKFTVKPIESLGKPFDPAFHQAVTQEESEDVEENIVLREFQKGYMIHDR